eukprot:CAMPEP_0169361110 /NCGR_PEP_ID=MMETSP1017-20121227/30165_1 /TAXON_ID=342587 /ORGANISM="Karlodinium micrum, Strain CCMP2283" /LENGTH=172 /DNA_ID=CAMNT_0009458471 /DNA_START=41 /DNA_END=559 /DNA_ORIENTATION=-
MTAAFGINAAKILTTNELAMDSAVDYPLKPCCAHKVVPGTISIKQEGAKYFLVVDDRKFSIYDENDSSGFPWGDVGAHSIGIFTERNEEEMHFKDTCRSQAVLARTRAEIKWHPMLLHLVLKKELPRVCHRGRASLLAWISSYLRQISSAGSGFPLDMAANAVCAEKDDETC